MGLPCRPSWDDNSTATTSDESLLWGVLQHHALATTSTNTHAQLHIGCIHTVCLASTFSLTFHVRGHRADGQKVFDTHGIPDLRFTAHDLSNQAEGGAQRRSRSPSASSGEDAARTRSAATCKLPATQYATAVNGVQFILHGIRIGIPGVSNAEVVRSVSDAC